MQRIAEALAVSARQISKDLSRFEPSSKPPRPKGGRPKGVGQPKPPKKFSRETERRQAMK